MIELSSAAVTTDGTGGEPKKFWYRFPIAAFIFSRIAIMSVAWISLRLDPNLHRPGGPLAIPALEGLCRWDCGWFERIARDGYQIVGSAIFFPLFPMLGAALHYLTSLPYTIALVVVANLVSLVGLVFAYRVFLLFESEAIARAAIMMLVSWPFSFFQATGYADCFLLLSSSVGIYLALQRRHLWAGVAVGVGALGRHLALLASLSLLAIQLRDRGFKSMKSVLDRDLLGLLIPFLFFLVFPIFLMVRFGNPWLFVTLRTGEWQSAGIWDYFSRAWWPEITVYVIFSLIPLAGSLLLLTRQSWWSLAPYPLAILAAAYAIGLGGLGRHASNAWPAFLPLAYFAHRRSLHMPIICAFAMLQGMFVYLYSHSYPIQ